MVSTASKYRKVTHIICQFLQYNQGCNVQVQVDPNLHLPMNKLLILSLFLISFILGTADDDCSAVYQSATYALSHSKMALNANNFDHQVYYSGKTLKAYKKIADGMQHCGCENAGELILDITMDAKKAADPADWARGRYYSKKVYLNTLDLITILDEWAAAKMQTEIPSDQRQ